MIGDRQQAFFASLSPEYAYLLCISFCYSPPQNELSRAVLPLNLHITLWMLDPKGETGNAVTVWVRWGVLDRLFILISPALIFILGAGLRHLS